MKNRNVKTSRFFKWLILFLIVFVISIGAYLLADWLGGVDWYVSTLRQENSNLVPLNFFLIFLVAVIYGVISLYNLLSHKASEDSREHCLPIILSPFFLLIENGFVHAFKFADGDPYYEIIMGIFSGTALGVITFASLKFSFEISTKHNRLIETSDAKPDIRIRLLKNNTYAVHIDRKECYLYGAYIGTIKKIRYWDIKRTGNYFQMVNLFYPNNKQYFKVGTHKINLNKLSNTAPRIQDELVKGNDVYLIFRDTTNYYYLAQVPTCNIDYNIIGISEPIMERLVYIFSKKKNTKFPIKFISMDWFNIPYNFKPNFTP